MSRSCLFTDNWTFLILPLGSDLKDAALRFRDFKNVELPHDWLIWDTDRLDKEAAETGWYRKCFHVNWEQGESILLRFDGIYMDSAVYMNGSKVVEWKNGYTSFEADLTPHLIRGENELVVSVNYETPNSRWYSGAGIYRDVWLIRQPEQHLVSDGIYIVTKQQEQGYLVAIDTELKTSIPVCVRHTVREMKNGFVAAKSCGTDNIKGIQTVRDEILVCNPKIWSLEDPSLYELITELCQGDTVLDTQITRFGFRTAGFEPDRGFLLNGKQVKLRGVCEHHDLGCLGAAFNRSAMKRKFIILKEMGCNAVRISHNMPAAEVIKLAEEMGILLVSELYDMWERPKNSHDFARFFKDCYKLDTASWVRRDRNSPSVIMWSIGNEIYDTHVDRRGLEITVMLTEEVRKHDPAENARVTLASNYMPWENARQCADIVKLAGYNYSEKYYRQHHIEHPDWIIYGSETASVVQSRGIYHFPQKQQILTDEDRQCSSLGNSITSWGAKSVDACLLADRDTEFSCGQFIWTGFDYIGEPTPYHTKNSYFGQVDTAGFAKDSYYLYQSAWTDYITAPMIHIFPYWDFNEGQMIDIGIFTNAPYAELIVNGVSQGRQRIDHEKGDCITAFWQVPYHRGCIAAIAYDEEGNKIAEDEQKSFGDAVKLKLIPDKTILTADGRDLIFITTQMLDRDGVTVENANNRVDVTVTGAGRLVGLDNGDSTDKDEYKGTSRRLFSGKLLIVIAATNEAGSICVRAACTGMGTAELILQAEACQKPERNSVFFERNMDRPRKMGWKAGEDIPVRKIELICPNGNIISGKDQSLSVKAVCYPPDSTYTELEWSVTDDAGIPSSIASLKVEGKEAILSAIGDGSCRVRCMTRNGTDNICLISQIEFHVKGIGHICLDPYGFIYGGQYSYSNGNAGNGNERGFATARDGRTEVGFQNLDFGLYGSDILTLPVFGLTGDAYPIQIWEGIPGEAGSELLADVIYQKPSIWNVYQEETYRLKKRLKGITSICFVLNAKVHIKGFYFKKLNRAGQLLYASDADSIYGDSYVLEADCVRGIGNNVSLEFKELDFGNEGIAGITICGHSIGTDNSILICFSDGNEDHRQLVEFEQTEGPEEKSFVLDKVCGVQTVTFLFLPGSSFDFNYFEFKLQEL